jgi:hypothetical protein
MYKLSTPSQKEVVTKKVVWTCILFVQISAQPFPQVYLDEVINRERRQCIRYFR